MPSHQPPDRQSAGGQGARREGGQRLQLSGQQVLQGCVAADSGCFPSMGPSGEGALLSPKGALEYGGLSEPHLSTAGGRASLLCEGRGGGGEIRGDVYSIGHQIIVNAVY